MKDHLFTSHVSAGADSFVITEATAYTLWISENAFQVFIAQRKASLEFGAAVLEKQQYWCMGVSFTQTFVAGL